MREGWRDFSLCHGFLGFLMDHPPLISKEYEGFIYVVLSMHGSEARSVCWVCVVKPGMNWQWSKTGCIGICVQSWLFGECCRYNHVAFLTNLIASPSSTHQQLIYLKHT